MPSVSLLRPRLPQLPRLRARFAAWLDLRSSRAALARLDDHLLADIGLERGYADREASRPFWQA
ncbi:MAG: DUF1127 domain-containing protein [Rhodobacteraceae bacterium]|nr:DUF1127 domain-containing protein [Paracoccaceae bacterium]